MRRARKTYVGLMSSNLRRNVGITIYKILKIANMNFVTAALHLFEMEKYYTIETSQRLEMQALKKIVLLISVV